MKTFLLPDLGEGLTDSEIVAWRVAEGDTVELNQPLADIETAKAIVELPSPTRARSPSCTPARARPSTSARRSSTSTWAMARLHRHRMPPVRSPMRLRMLPVRSATSPAS
ncbi:biotin/lipoyl-containing protein [Agrococcus sp. ARC_14]|uniref:biotin/lipoyl-containing protein n=1 Tax=Agrococcus sp. ARC_14 TaxID=2919927 RepID=UPI001F05FFCA|nr:biotin/lipoyl-containing protein [Agrococcus sp. ARC_14]MCH1883382.1 hypothetical protein [Agrococcus sp. ARC_14]